MSKSDLIPELPKTVSRISVQKKNKSRFSLYDEEHFIMGVSDAVLTRFNIRKGTVITYELYESITQGEEYWKMREYLIGLLSRRDHARHELRLKAKKKDYDPHLLEKCLDELEEKGYIDNYGFAQKFVNDKFEFNQWGPTKIRIELIRKGIDAKVADQVLDEVLNREDMVATIHHLVAKKKQKFLRDDPNKRRKKLFDFLLRKGYDSSVILKEIDRLLTYIEQ